MQITSITNIVTALQLFNSKTELETKDIKYLFGLHSDTTAVRLKKQVWKVMAENNIRCWSKSAVNTKCAYKVWQIDVDELEKMYLKLKKLDLLQILSK